MAASLLLLRLEGELRTRHGVGEVSHALLRKIQAAPKTQLERCLAATKRHRRLNATARPGSETDQPW